jgi:peptidylprolyl isomerase
LLMVSFIALWPACTSNKPAATDSEENPGVDESIVKKGVKPEADAEAAVIETDYGRIVIELYPNVAPKMVARFKQLINEGVYTGTSFHRVNSSLGIIQAGDPLSKDNDPANDGTGDSSYPNVPAEFSDVPYDRGIVGAARKGGGIGMTEAEARDTANAQFFVTLKRVPDFDKRYTVFGKVIEGIGNADIIAGAPTDGGGERPAENIIIRRMTLQPRTNFK